MKHRSPICDVASPSECAFTVRTIRAEQLDRVVQLRGVITRMHPNAIDAEKCFRLQDEPTFTPAGSTPRSILVISEADAQDSQCFPKGAETTQDKDFSRHHDHSFPASDQARRRAREPISGEITLKRKSDRRGR
jgi:hypothetical protein